MLCDFSYFSDVIQEIFENESMDSVQGWIDALKTILDRFLPDESIKGEFHTKRVDRIMESLDDYLLRVTGKGRGVVWANEHILRAMGVRGNQDDEDTFMGMIEEWMHVASIACILLVTSKQLDTEKTKTTESSGNTVTEELIPNPDSRVTTPKRKKKSCTNPNCEKALKRSRRKLPTVKTE